MPVTGSCFCGEIAYKVDKPLKNARSCHCSRCRKIYGGAASAFADIEAGSFHWTKGESFLTSYGKNAGLYFCKQCGTPLCGYYEGEIMGVMLGPIDGDPGVTLEHHIFVGSKAPWDEIGGDTPQFDEYPKSKD